MTYLRAPFMYMGGKSRVANVVWSYLGDVPLYLEPFFGSGAVLLARPNFDPAKHVEAVNDINGLLVNAWRAIQHAPDEVARYLDIPASDHEMRARWSWLQARAEAIQQGCISDPDFYDARAAGYWIYCQDVGVYSADHRRAPYFCVDASNGAEKILALRVRASSVPSNGTLPLDAPYAPYLYQWMRALCERLRHVRIRCGDWLHLVEPRVSDREPVGVFLDPPYSAKRYRRVYRYDSFEVAHAVREWCLANGGLSRYRIVLAGYVGEHDELVRAGWRMHRWKGSRAWNHGNPSPNSVNRLRECLYISPHCLESRLFGDEELASGLAT